MRKNTPSQVASDKAPSGRKKIWEEHAEKYPPLKNVGFMQQNSGTAPTIQSAPVLPDGNSDQGGQDYKPNS